MSDEGTDVWELLKREVVELHGQWYMYSKLYGDSQEVVDLLNRSARTFFALNEAAMIRDLHIGIGRLTDPGSSRGRDNLSLSQLLDLPVVEADSDLKTRIESKLEEISEKARPFRLRRNRSVAHLDLATLTGAEVLPGVTRNDVDEILGLIAEAMNMVELKVSDGTMFYADPIHAGGAEALVSRLKKAEKYQQQLKDRVRAAGKSRPKSWRESLAHLLRCPGSDGAPTEDNNLGNVIPRA